MPVGCAECGCVVEDGLRTSVCGDAGCCCAGISTRADLDRLAAELERALAARDLSRFGALLSDDCRWGDDDAPNRCRSRADVVGTFERALSDGVSGDVSLVSRGPAGLLCKLRIEWPAGASRRGRTDLYHLYRVRQGRIVEIEPFDDLEEARLALAQS